MRDFSRRKMTRLPGVIFRPTPEKQPDLVSGPKSDPVADEHHRVSRGARLRYRSCRRGVFCRPGLTGTHFRGRITAPGLGDIFAAGVPDSNLGFSAQGEGELTCRFALMGLASRGANWRVRPQCLKPPPPHFGPDHVAISFRLLDVRASWHMQAEPTIVWRSEPLRAAGKNSQSHNLVHSA